MENIDEDQFNLLMKIAKKYAFQLPDEVERAKALKWLKNLGEAKDPAVLKVKHHALQILLMCLQRGKLVGPFADGIEVQTKFLEYAWAYQPECIADLLVRSDVRRIGEPDISYEMSGDLTEFTAYQEIPAFGMHFYYAFSPEDFLKWDNLNSALVPPGMLNLAKVHTPESSTLAQNLNESAKEKAKEKKEASKQYAENIEKQATEFVDVSIIGKSGKIKEGFKDENPPASELNTELLDKAIDAGVVNKEEIQIEKGIIPDHEKVKTPLVEKVKIKKGPKKLVKKKKWKNALTDKSDLDSAEEREKVAEARRKELEKEKEEMLSKMPAGLREKLAARREKIEKKRAERAEAIKKEEMEKEKARKKSVKGKATGPMKKGKMEDKKGAEKSASAKSVKNLESAKQSKQDLAKKVPRKSGIPQKGQRDTQGIIDEREETGVAADECGLLAFMQSFEETIENLQVDRAAEANQQTYINERKRQLLYIVLIKLIDLSFLL